MFSTNQMDMIPPMVESYLEQGYQYYLVHTNTNLTNNYTSYNFADLTFYFSKEPITYQQEKFVFTGEYKKLTCLTRNVSNNNDDNKVDRITLTNHSSGSVTVPLYEHIMSNCENTIFMNTLGQTEYNQVNDISYNIDVNDFYVPVVVLCVLVLTYWLKTWFAKTYKKEK